MRNVGIVLFSARTHELCPLRAPLPRHLSLCIQCDSPEGSNRPEKIQGRALHPVIYGVDVLKVRHAEEVEKCLVKFAMLRPHVRASGVGQGGVQAGGLGRIEVNVKICMLDYLFPCPTCSDVATRSLWHESEPHLEKATAVRAMRRATNMMASAGLP